MEFFKNVHGSNLDISGLKKLLSIDNLPRLCACISSVIHTDENEADIYCLWGAFDLKREEIRYGVRFSLLNCPHALAWTVTLDEENQAITIHCTINEVETDEDFVFSIREFVTDWSTGIRDFVQ